MLNKGLYDFKCLNRSVGYLKVELIDQQHVWHQTIYFMINPFKTDSIIIK